MQLIELPREQYDGFEITAGYVSRSYYSLTLQSDGTALSAQLVRTPCDPEKREFSNLLFSPCLDDPHAWGLLHQHELIGLIEVSPDTRRNTLQITNLCVQEGYRRRGYGHILITRAKEIALTQKRRAIEAEVQGCNSPAISFYLSLGFQFSGFEAYRYSNQDQQDHTVCMKLTCLL